ncbi:metallophosphoesterase family protein [Thermococcus sp.]
MKRSLGLILVLLVGLSVLASGCISGGGGSTTSSRASTGGTSTTPSNGIDFGKYPPGGVIGHWNEIFGKTFYVSPGYEGMVKAYFPDAVIKPSSEYDGIGIAVLSPSEARPKLSGKPVHVTKLDYFGYVAYRYGMHFPGPWEGVIAALNSNKGGTLIVTGTSKAGVGAALNFLKGVEDGKLSVDTNAVIRKSNFEGLVVKEIGDVNMNGVPDKGELVELYQLSFEEPFQYYWRVIDGENVTVSGGFIKLVNGTTVYIRALGFNVSVEVKNPKGLELTYVVENVNPAFLNLPENATVNGTTVTVKTSGSFSLTPKAVQDYYVLAFGDHRPPSGDKVPEVFLKIMAGVNNETGAFVIDGGDLVYSGTIWQWDNLMKVWKWNKPIFVAAGNHEYQGEGISVYHYVFGPTEYAFSLGGYRYIFDNDVMGNYQLSDKQLKWIKEQMEIAKARGEMPVVVMHAPPYDPRPGGDDHAMDEESAKKLLALMKEYGAFGIFSHIHLYWDGTYDGVHFIITGGGGAPLYAPPDEGGFYHYVILDMKAGGDIGIKVVKVS